MSIIPKLDVSSLELLGLTERDYTIYAALLQLGSAPLRRVAEATGVSRGTVHDTLKRLIDLGLVGYVDAKTHRHFQAEDPQRLRALATQREVAAQETRERIGKLLPELKELAGSAEHRPVVRYYDGDAGVRSLLEDVLAHTSKLKQKRYRVYSSAGIRDLIRHVWPQFSAARKRKAITVRSLAIGEGGQTVGLDERKWLTRKESAPTYIFIYGRKTAYVAQDEKQRLFGVMIEDGDIARTQRLIFDTLWHQL